MVAHRVSALVALAALVALLVGCPAEAPPPLARPIPRAVNPATPLPDARDDGRLPPLATPASYRLDLRVDPAQPRFTGSVSIDVDVPQRTSHVVLHAHAIDVSRARAVYGPPNGQQELVARASMRTANAGKTPEELVLSFEQPLPAGRITLEIAYSAPFDSELSGLYRVKEGDRFYAFTQFEAVSARRAFPCFDEPSFKVPFTLSITPPPGMIALANTPEISRDGGTFRFAPTPPLPTYLVALAVGDFEIREVARTEKPPIRLVTPKGKVAAHGDLALETTAALLTTLEQYFGIPYPYAKLDLVAVPEFGPGAMENPGLITFNEPLLLLDPKRASVAARRSQALVIAHELAHQWFGNLVTASWWNDIWLNEGMATWIEWRVVDRWQPSFGAKEDAIASAHSVMDIDSLASARAVRQPVVSSGQASEAFDPITYTKGAAVLSTIEKWVGEDAFRRGIRSYLEQNAWKSVQADKLLTALDQAAGKDVTQMASAFLDRPGVPVVDAHLECRGGRWHAELTQESWRPLGSTSPAPEDDDRVWTVPVCVRAQGDPKSTTCADLAFGAPSLVAGKGRCPGAIHPNVHGSYYRFVLPDKELLRLGETRKELDVAERISVLSNAWAAVRAGKVAPKTIVKLLPMFDEDSSRHVVAEVVDILSGMDTALVEDDARPAFRRYVAARLAKRKRGLGWLPKAAGKEGQASSGDEALLRRAVLPAMGDLAEDQATLAEAEELAAKWLSDPSSVDSDTAAIAVDLASRRAGEARLDALRESAKKAQTREDRIIALRAMSGFDDPALIGKALDLSLTDEIRLGDIRYLFGAAFARRRARPIAEAWVREHWEPLRKKLPGRLAAGLVNAASVGCTKTAVAERAAFYTPRAASIEGAERPLAEALERVSLCAELRGHGSFALGKALDGEPKSR